MAHAPHPPRQGVDIASDGRLIPALILLLAACEQATEELQQADLAVEGLGAEIRTLSTRLRDLLATVA